MKFDSKFINHMMIDIQKLPGEIVEMKGGAFKKFQEEDFKLLESDRAIFDWASKQTYIPFANMMTAAAIFCTLPYRIPGVASRLAIVLVCLIAFTAPTTRSFLGWERQV